MISKKAAMLMVVAVSVGIVVLADSKWSVYKEVTSLRTNDFFSVAQPDLSTNAKIAMLNMPFDASGAGTTAAYNATNPIGSAAFHATSFFDLAGAAAAATNAAGIVGIVVAGIGPATNGSTATFTGETNTSLTASRVKLTDANKAEVSAAASGAVPIDADGSASTGGQITNLLTGSAALNGAQIVGTVPAATTAGTATTATSLSGEGTIATTNAANQTGLTFALGILKFWATNVVVGSFTNANGGLGASNLTVGTVNVTGNSSNKSVSYFGSTGQAYIDVNGNITASAWVNGSLSNSTEVDVKVGGTTDIAFTPGVVNIGSGAVIFFNGANATLNGQSIPVTLNKSFSVAGTMTASSTGTFTNGVVSNSRRLLAPVSISVTGSPFNWTNSSAGGSGGTNCIIVGVDGPAVTGTVSINGGAWGTLPGFIPCDLQPGEYVTVTYSVGTPVMTWKPF